MANSWLVSVGWWTKSLPWKNCCFTKHPLKTWLFGVPGGGVLLGEFFYSDALMRKQYYWYEPKNPRIAKQKRNKRFFLRLLAEYEMKFCRIRNLTHTELLLCFVFLISNSLFTCIFVWNELYYQIIANHHEYCVCIIWEHVNLSHEDKGIYPQCHLLLEIRPQKNT